jgi:formate hydrogenlyase subunit 3/multisubunit Na+/H+ antiporter MnhD subunit
MFPVTHPVLMAIWLPIAAGLACLLLPRAARALHAGIGVAVTAATLWLGWRVFDAGEVTVEAGPALPFTVDGLSAFVALAVAAFGLLISVYSVGYLKGRDVHREYFACLLVTVGAALGAVLAGDLVVLLVCWGVLGVTLYLMIGLAGPDAASAASKSFMIVGGSDAALLLGVALVWGLTGTTRMDAGPIPLDGPVPAVALLAFVIATFAKAGAVPLHCWVPDCGERADAPVSALLPASLDKFLGIYLLARCALDLFALGTTANGLLMAAGAITVVAAAMMAIVQHDLKRLLAYSTVSQVGYMLLGIGTGTAVGFAGGLFHMLNHAVYKSGLFLCAGAVDRAAGTAEFDRLGGLGRAMPVTFACSLVFGLAVAGVPPLNGFASKWMVYQGLIASAPIAGGWWMVWLAAAMLGSALTLASFVKVLHATFLCPPAPEIERRDIRERSVTMLAPMAILAVICVVFGVFAAAVPLRWLVLPALPAEVTGVWWSGTATALLLVGLGAGLALYWVTMAAGKLRRTATYIGGEDLDETYIRGVPRDRARHVAVTGVDFYRTFEVLPLLARGYALAKHRALDVYEWGGLASGYAVGLLRRAHGGLLPVYVVWFLAGLVAVLVATVGGLA